MTRLHMRPRTEAPTPPVGRVPSADPRPDAHGDPYGAGRATPAERRLRSPARAVQPEGHVADSSAGRSETRSPPSSRRSRRGRVARLVWGGVVTVVLVAVLLLFVFPTRTYLDQRHQLAVAAQRLRLLSTQNGLLAARIDTLHTDAEIERIARGQYHLVRPGERAFAILPAPPVSAATSPAVGLPAHRASGWSRLWHRLTSFL